MKNNVSREKNEQDYGGKAICSFFLCIDSSWPLMLLLIMCSVIVATSVDICNRNIRITA